MAFRNVRAVASRPTHFARQSRFRGAGGRSFSVDVAAWCAMAEGNVEAAIKKIVVDIFSRVIMRTPVLTGRARANWVVGLNAPAIASASLLDTDPGPVNPTGTGTSITKDRMIAKVQAAKAKNTHSYILTNNVAYAIRLEYGWSRRQAPAGMVRITIREFNRIIQRAVAEVKKGNTSIEG